MSIFAKDRVDIPCPSCGHKTKQQIGRLEKNPAINCPKCYKPFTVDMRQFKAATKKVEANLDKLTKGGKR